MRMMDGLIPMRLTLLQVGHELYESPRRNTPFLQLVAPAHRLYSGSAPHDDALQVLAAMSQQTLHHLRCLVRQAVAAFPAASSFVDRYLVAPVENGRVVRIKIRLILAQNFDLGLVCKCKQA
jgi:hypothetical protein